MAAERGGYEHANPFINIAFSHRQCSRQYWGVMQSRSCACAYTWCLPRFSLSRRKVFDFFFLQILSGDIKKFCNKMRLLLVLFMSLCHCEMSDSSFFSIPVSHSLLFSFCLLCCYQQQVRNVPVIDAHQCTASDRSRQHEKRSFWNKYICNEGKRGRQMACQFVFVKGWNGVTLTYRSIIEPLLKSFGGVYSRRHTFPNSTIFLERY